MQDPLAAFVARVRAAAETGALVRLKLKPLGMPPVEVRPVRLAAGPAWSFVTHEPTRDLTQNHATPDAVGEIERILAGGGTAFLETGAGAWQLVATPGRRPRLVSHGKSAAPAAPAAHNRARASRLGPEAAPWLRALGLLGESGRPTAETAKKCRQIERYADLLAHAAEAARFEAGAPVRVADMGCGKGYLTFAAWHVLRNGLRLDARVTGIDVRRDVLESARAAIPADAGDTLAFVEGTIETAPLDGVDVLIALHACNAATDAALARGVAAGARLILVAPCCHKDLRRVLGAPDPLASVLAHGLFRERFAEWLTDALRALALEAAGYRVTVADFIEAEHTPKNLLLRAVRGLPDARRAAARGAYARVKSWAGLPGLPTDAIVSPAPLL